MMFLIQHLLCALVLRAAAENVETRIYQLLIPFNTSKVGFGTSLQDNKLARDLFIGSPKTKGIYECGFSFFGLSTPPPVACTRHLVFGDKNSSVGYTMGMLQGPKSADFLVVCGNQYTFTCPDVAIQQRMIGECYSHNLNTGAITSITSPCPEKCPQGALFANIVFLLDASGSVGESNFNLALRWINDVLVTLKDEINSGDLQVGYVTFSETVGETMSPRQLTYNQLADIILAIEYTDGGTRTDLAIEEATYLLSTSSRPKAAKVMITITDGKSNNEALTTLAATDARDVGAVMIAVGVGGGVDVNELRRIATGDVNDPKNVMTVSSYDNLDSILDELGRAIKETATLELEGKDSDSTSELTSCQFGTSVATSSDGLYIGGMGSYDRTGTVLQYTNVAQFPTSTSSGHLNDTELAVILGTTAKQIRDSYFGYSVDTGKFTNDNKKWVAMGGPRYLSKGTVLVHEAGSKTNFFNVHPNQNSGYWQLGAGFGQSVLAMDVNNDGYDDLLISAPTFSQLGGYDEGLVFVYINDKSSNPWVNTPIVLEGSKSPRSRFGMSLARAGDIDKNGFDDIIIGAPSEKEYDADLSSGAVYVYFSSVTGPDPIKYQRINGKTLTSGSPASLSGFGRTLLGDSDFDFNDYPDIAIGAPSSDSVVLLRSRRLIVVTTTLSASPSEVNFDTCASNQTLPCSTITVCVSAQFQKDSSGELFDMVQNITLDSLTPESFKRRFYFMDSKTSFKTIPDARIGNIAICENYEIQIDINGVSKINGGGLERIPRVEFTVDLAQSYKDQTMSGVMSSGSQKLRTTDLSISKACSGGTGERCEHELILKATAYSEPITSTPIILEGNSRILTVDCELENDGPDPAYFLNVNISSGHLTVNRVVGNCMIISDDESDVANGVTVLKYERSTFPSYLMPSGSKCEFTIEFGFTRLQQIATASLIQIHGKVFSSAGRDTIAYDPITGNNEFTYTKRVQYKSVVVLSGSSAPGSIFIVPPVDQSVKIITTLEDDILGGNSTKVAHKYWIYNSGPLGLANAKAKITWPELTAAGYDLFYLIDIRCEPADGCTCYKQGKRNKYGIPLVEKTSIEFNVKYPNNAEIVNSADGLTCDNSKCNDITCDIKHMEKFDLITMYASFKPWVPTFGKDFRSAIVYTSFKLIPANSTVLPIATDAAIASTLTAYDPSNPPPPPPQVSPNYGAIIGSIIGGLILLAIVIFVMWKTGFFNSKYAKLIEEAKASADRVRQEIDADIDALEGNSSSTANLTKR